jgi:hypothetical protein
MSELDTVRLLLTSTLLFIGQHTLIYKTEPQLGVPYEQYAQPSLATFQNLQPCDRD